MLALYVTMPDNSKWELKEENATPREILIKAFKHVGCKTLNEWNKIISRANLVGYFGNFKPDDYLQPNEIAG